MFWKRKKAEEQGPTPASEIATARALVERGELEHATSHLAWALRRDPLSQDGLALLRRLITMARDPLSLAPFGREETSDHVAGVRAYIHAWRGEIEDAVGVLVQIYRAVPDLPFFPWLLQWLAKPESDESLDPGTMLQLVVTLGEKLADEDSAQQIERLLPLLARYLAAHPEASMLAAYASKLPRELGRLDEALAIARRAYDVGPDVLTACMLAGAYRARGEFDQAVATWRLALQHTATEANPDIADSGPEILLDIGDVLCDTGRLQEGLDAYAQVLEGQPEHPWARPSYLYYRGQLEPEGPWQEQLQAFVERHPDNQRAQDLLGQQMPYIAYLPEPGEATINLLRQLAEADIDPDSPIEIGLSSLEAPSAMRAMDLHMIQRFGRSGVRVSVGKIQRPDPRVPRGQVEHLLWRYRGTTPQPNVEPPAADVAQALAWLAARPYTLASWSRQAREVARHLGPRRLADLLGAMVHPPAPREPYPIWTWLLRVQLAACLTIAALDDGWQGSLRRRALLDLARGPMDWSVGAALVALGRIAEEEPASVDEIGALLLELMTSLPSPGGVPYVDALLGAATRLPRMPAELARQLNSLLED